MQPLPDIDDEDTAPFWQATCQNSLVVQACDSCGEMRFPPHPYCAGCRSPSVSWVPVSGRGTIWSFVIAHQPTLPGFAEFTPYPVVVVTLDEGKHLRMVGNVVAAPGAAINSVTQAELAIGQPVQVTFEAVEDVALPRWVLVK